MYNNYGTSVVRAITSFFSFSSLDFYYTLLLFKQTLSDVDLRRNMHHFSPLGDGVVFGFCAALGAVVQLRNNKVGRTHLFLILLLTIILLKKDAYRNRSQQTES